MKPTPISQVPGVYPPIGPYSQASKVALPGGGGIVWTSGIIALDSTGQQLVSADVRTQTETALTYLKAILKAAGTDLDHVVQVTIFLASMADFPTVNTVYAQFFTGAVKPTRQTVAVKELPKGALVEISAMAVFS